MVTQKALGWVARNDTLKKVATSTPITRDVARRFVAGERTGDAVRVAGELAGTGLRCTISYLGETATTVEQAEAMVDNYRRLVAGLQEADLTDRAELSIKLTSLGSALPDLTANKIALENVRKICELAASADLYATVDMEDQSTIDDSLETVRILRQQYPWVGVALQAYLLRTQSDCRELTYEGSRVRLCKGAYGPADEALQTRQDVDLAFVKCLKILMGGTGYPMVATHDPRLIEITTAVAVRNGRERSSYEFQMLYGIRSDEQKRLAALGERVRVYVPYGTHWYPWLLRRMVEKPSNTLLFARSLPSVI